jgi:hypothetical protein
MFGCISVWIEIFQLYDFDLLDKWRDIGIIGYSVKPSNEIEEFALHIFGGFYVIWRRSGLHFQSFFGMLSVLELSIFFHSISLMEHSKCLKLKAFFRFFLILVSLL